jgi:hypothetical protein
MDEPPKIRGLTKKKTSQVVVNLTQTDNQAETQPLHDTANNTVKNSTKEIFEYRTTLKR